MPQRAMMILYRVREKWGGGKVQDETDLRVFSWARRGQYPSMHLKKSN